MNPAGDTKKNAQRHSGCFGSLFSRKSAAVTHFADIISETPDVNEIQQWSKESVPKLVTNDHEKAPVEEPEKIKQLAKNTEACTSENNWLKASNKGQSQDSATNSDEALPNPEKEIEVKNLLMENDKQPVLCKWTEILEKPDPEASTQPITNHQRENLSRDEAEKDVNDKGYEEPKVKSNSESSAENEKLRKRVQKLEENLAEFQEQLKQLQFEKNQLCNKATSHIVALESVQPESEQNHNALAIAETSPEFMLDPTYHPALTDCQPTLMPVINKQPDINEEPIEEQKIAPNNELSHLTSDQNIHQREDMAKTKASETGAAAKRGRPSKVVDNTDDSEALQSKKLKVAETVVEEKDQEAKVEASDVEKTEPAAAKKGRGRPKRAEPEAKLSATAAKVEEPSSAVKKGRSRSKANAKAVNGGANKTKKGRGRPKKANSSEK